MILKYLLSMSYRVSFRYNCTEMFVSFLLIFILMHHFFLQLYYEKIKELTVNRSNPFLFKEALQSLATDSGIHPVVPYFTYFVSDEVIVVNLSPVHVTFMGDGQ